MSSRPRDPETGQFLSGQDLPDFGRFEEVYASEKVRVPAADLDGTAANHLAEDEVFRGVQLYDVDELLDRDELGVLIWAEHALDVFLAATATADGTMWGGIEVSASPEPSGINFLMTSSNLNEIDDQSGGDFSFDDATASEVTADLIGRYLQAVSTSPIADGTNGVGGSGTPGKDWWEGQPIAAPTFDARDEVYVSGAAEFNNVADNTGYMTLSTRHVFGVIEDFFN